jgi:hypothetical protein
MGETDALEARDGRLTAPDGPGLGIELDEDVLKENRAEGECVVEGFCSDDGWLVLAREIRAIVRNRVASDSVHRVGPRDIPAFLGDNQCEFPFKTDFSSG